MVVAVAVAVAADDEYWHRFGILALRWWCWWWWRWQLTTNTGIDLAY